MSGEHFIFELNSLVTLLDKLKAERYLIEDETLLQKLSAYNQQRQEIANEIREIEDKFGPEIMTILTSSAFDANAREKIDKLMPYDTFFRLHATYRHTQQKMAILGKVIVPILNEIEKIKAEKLFEIDAVKQSIEKVIENAGKSGLSLEEIDWGKLAEFEIFLRNLDIE